MNIINLLDKFDQFDDIWSPKIVGELNNQYIKLAKFEGQMVWHSHAAEDEFFHVIEGEITIHLRDKKLNESKVILKAGECFIVPKGVEHMPEAKGIAKVLLFEPKSTAHTGQDKTALTVDIESQQWI